MAEYLSPGIYIEEVSNTGATVDAVGTSACALVGWTKMGPANEATLVTSPADFERKFGGFTRSTESVTPHAVSAYFANGGARGYMVRVTAADAVAATSYISEDAQGEVIGTGTGTGPLTVTGTLAQLPAHTGGVNIRWRANPAGTISAEDPTFSPLEGPSWPGPYVGTLANAPLVDGAITVTWTEAVQAVGVLTIVGAPPTILDEETFTLNDGVNPAKVFEFDDDDSVTAGNVAVDISALTTPTQFAAAIASAINSATNLNITATPNVGVVNLVNDTGGVAGNVAVTDTVASAPSFVVTSGMAGGTAATAKTVTVTGTSTVGGTDLARVSSANINRDTGELRITFAAKVAGTTNNPNANSIRVSYDHGGDELTVTDDGEGVFSDTTDNSTVVTGTVDYTTGAVSVTFTGGTDLPGSGLDVVAEYANRQWELEAANVGVWGNRLKVRVTGNENWFTYGDQSVTSAGTYSKFDVTVFLEDEVTGDDVVRETYEEVVFDDPDDAMYFPSLVNEASDLLAVENLDTLRVPSVFRGVDRTDDWIGTGDATPTASFTGTLNYAPVVKTSVVISYTEGGTVKTILAGVDGTLTGIDLDTSETNTVNYETGAVTLNFTTGSEPDAGTDITADYISAPASSYVDYTFTGGSDGTLANITRTVVSSPALQGSKLGMYALDRVDEMMQLVIPDFAGDSTVAGDQVDYAEQRRDLFPILCTPRGLSAQAAVDYKRVTFPRKSKYGAMYWPWLKVADPLVNGRTITMPPIAHVAGIYARTDATKNVGKAPGGTVDGALRSLIGLERNPDKGERDLVYPARINPLINTPQTGLAVWGVRTMSATNDVFRYINAVRLFMFVEKSVFNSTHGLVFESITGTYYTRIKAQIDGFLLNLFNSNHFAGSTPDQSYFVIVDDTNNPPEIANAGQVVVDVGIAPNRPGEFIRFRMAAKSLS